MECVPTKASAPMMVLFLWASEGVIVAGDGSRADIRARADFGIAQISQMACRDAVAQSRIFEFHKIADFDVSA